MVKPLNLSQVEVRGERVLASDEEVRDAERRLGTTFPMGYRDYVTRLGEGVLNDLIRVFPPWRVLAGLDEHRGGMAGFWSWHSDDVVFDQDDAMTSIPIADSLDGDVITFEPANPDRIIVLPRQQDRLYARGPDLLEVINWVCSGRVIRSLGPQRYFDPFDSRTQDLAGVADKPRESSASYTSHAPNVNGTARDVLLAYFDELRGVEEWAIERSGGVAAFEGNDRPDVDEDAFDELIARSDEVHRRYCSPSLASALSGASVMVSSPAEHDPASIDILEENPAGNGRVRITAAVGTEFAEVLEYVLETSAGAWRIVSRRVTGYLDP